MFTGFINMKIYAPTGLSEFNTRTKLTKTALVQKKTFTPSVIFITVQETAIKIKISFNFSIKIPNWKKTTK